MRQFFELVYVPQPHRKAKIVVREWVQLQQFSVAYLFPDDVSSVDFELTMKEVFNFMLLSLTKCRDHFNLRSIDNYTYRYECTNQLWSDLKKKIEVV